ncbi:hypothetical protein JSCD14_34960 [Clostridioides difficile]|nr:hypothetical protein JSCD14_34960 [Clostridioides difficile]
MCVLECVCDVLRYFFSVLVFRACSVERYEDAKVVRRRRCVIRDGLDKMKNLPETFEKTNLGLMLTASCKIEIQKAVM